VECDQEQFIQALRDHFPNMPGEFELCRVNASRRIVPLRLDSMCPAQIQASHALGRSALYIRPLVGKCVLRFDFQHEIILHFNIKARLTNVT